MATWEAGSRPLLRFPPRRSAAVGAASALLASGVVALAGAGPYWALRASLREFQVRAAASVLEVAPVRRTSAVVAGPVAPLRRAGAPPARPGAAVRVVFGRFAHPQDAASRARAVRRKGYIASVVPVGGSYVVVSRPYPTLEAARFWAGIFGEIGLRTQVVQRLEVLAGTDGS